jgi:long-chain acyl-CoA synthetase
MLSQKGLMADLFAGLKQVSLSPKTVAVLPPHHTYGCNVGLVAHVAAGSEVYLSDGLRYVQRELKREQPEHLTLVPLFVETFYRKILSTAKEQGKYALLRRMMKVSNAMRRVGIDVRRSVFRSVLDSFGGKLRLIISGGAPLSQEIIATFDAIGITILNGYGITECSPLISVNHNQQKLKAPGCVGTPLACNEVKLRDPNANGEGEICVKGENVMLGYYKNDEATADAFDDADFFRTGDYGKFDSEGNLYITGRLKNLIILSNGKNVYPEEIENALTAVGGILEIVVYEGQSSRGAEHNIIVAEIYPDADYLKKNGIEDARAYFQAAVDNFNRTAVAYKKISLLRLRETEFPKNTLRKILRFKIDMTID